MKATKWVIGIIVIILVIWGITAARGDRGTTETGPIKIGVILPLTGDAASLGENSLAAVKIAVGEINDTGGVGGRDVELIIEDGQCTGNVASNAANKLINVDGVDVILGGICSAETSAFTELGEQTQTPIVSPCSSAPALTDAGDYFFRVYPSDSFQGVFAANYLIDTFGSSKAAVLYTKDEWGEGIQATFIAEFERLGGEIVVVESFGKSDRDLRTQLTKIKAANPDALYFPGFSEASIPGIRQIREIGLGDITIIGGDPWSDTVIWDEVGEAGEGLLFTQAVVQEDADFTAKLAEVDAEPALCSPQAYDVVNILLGAIERAGTTDGPAIKDELYKTVYKGGVSSEEIRFDENGDVVGANYTVKEIVNGEIVDVE